MKPCTHKTPKDFQSGHENGRPVWICSNCGKTGNWDDSWSYWGSIECAKGAYGMRGCGWPDIEWVACSIPCAKALGLDEEP